jgi:hypothetical protein
MDNLPLVDRFVFKVAHAEGGDCNNSLDVGRTLSRAETPGRMTLEDLGVDNCFFCGKPFARIVSSEKTVQQDN